MLATARKRQLLQRASSLLLLLPSFATSNGSAFATAASAAAFSSPFGSRSSAQLLLSTSLLLLDNRHRSCCYGFGLDNNNSRNYGSIKSSRLPSSMKMSSSGSLMMAMEEFFLSQREHNKSSSKKTPPSYYVIGNPAGDADSIISALTLAYIDSMISPQKDVIPVVSIPQKDLETQRPETLFLFKLANLIPTNDDTNDNNNESKNLLDSLCYVDEIRRYFSSLEGESGGGVRIALVDHNRLEDGIFAPPSSSSSTPEVIKILDHHYDEGLHAETTTGAENRNIAFDNANGTALVASTCTLVTEHLVKNQPSLLASSSSPLLHPSLSILLLGVILLDSVNMSPQAGRGTQRDKTAIQFLLSNTDWSEVSAFARKQLWPSLSSSQTLPLPDTTVLFDLLQSAKFDPVFWNSLSVFDALRLDYKQFTSKSDMVFGASTVLVPVQDFVSKPNVLHEIRTYMAGHELEFLVVLFFSRKEKDDGATSVLRRQLLLCGKGENGKAIVRTMTNFLVNHDPVLQAKDEGCITEDEDLFLQELEQGNVKASRKQVVPVMLQFFEHQHREEEAKL